MGENGKTYRDYFYFVHCLSKKILKIYFLIKEKINSNY